jgi:hypothetical protein
MAIFDFGGKSPCEKFSWMCDIRATFANFLAIELEQRRQNREAGRVRAGDHYENLPDEFEEDHCLW